MADPSERSTRLLSDRIAVVYKYLPRALAGGEDAVHQLRVSGRRLRVALPLLAREPHSRPARRARSTLRQLTRAAGTNRDLEVALSLFDERLRSLGRPSAERRVLRRPHRAALGRSRTRMVDLLLDLEIARLRRDLRAVVARRSEVLFTVLIRVRDERDRRAGRILHLLEALGDRFDAAQLHRARRQIRRLRYMAEIQEVLRGQEGEAAGILRTLQDDLGRLHDAFVVSEWLGGQARAAQVSGRAPLAEEASAQQLWFREESRRHHRTFLESRPAERVQQAVEAMSNPRPAASPGARQAVE